MTVIVSLASMTYFWLCGDIFSLVGVLGFLALAFLLGRILCMLVLVISQIANMTYTETVVFLVGLKIWLKLP